MSAYLVSKLDARRLFFIAMIGFIVGCCASLFATNYPVLLASRLVQAIGAGILLPLIQVVALSVYPKSQYGKAMGIVGIIIGFAPAIGPAISGFIVDAWGWRAVFVALGTVSAVVTLLAIPFLPNVMRKPATHQRFDALSAVLFSFGAICLLVATACIEQSGWGVVAAASIALGAVLLFTFARRQLRIPNPLLKLHALRIANSRSGLRSCCLAICRLWRLPSWFRCSCKMCKAPRRRFLAWPFCPARCC